MDPKWNEDQPIYRQLRDRVVAMILESVLLMAMPCPRSGMLRLSIDSIRSLY